MKQTKQEKGPNMKKILSLMLAVMLMLSLCACSEDVIEEVVIPIGDIITENLPPETEDFDFPIDNLPTYNPEYPEGDMSWKDWFDWVESELGDVTDSTYNGQPYYTINDNVPFFTDDDKITEPFEEYSELDYLGRCGVAYANICRELMPKGERGDISSITPSGWKYKGTSNNNEYDTVLVEGGRIYNRCHLIGFQLAGENDNKLNLVTGTRYMNVTGMLPFENMVDDYVDETGNHVLYRVTPVYQDEELVCRGVILEAWSVEDNGEGICFNVYCYNVQPGIEINYETGENWLSDTFVLSENTENDNDTTTYVLNTNSMKFHYEHCDSATQMSEKNKAVIVSTRDDLIGKGYKPCGQCKP